MTTETATLIEHWIDANPAGRGVANARLRQFGVPVWALIGDLPLVGSDPGQLATLHAVPPAAVEAALAFYAQHRAEVDARLAANDAQFERPELQRL